MPCVPTTDTSCGARYSTERAKMASSCSSSACRPTSGCETRCGAAGEAPAAWTGAGVGAGRCPGPGPGEAGTPIDVTDGNSPSLGVDFVNSDTVGEFTRLRRWDILPGDRAP